MVVDLSPFVDMGQLFVSEYTQAKRVFKLFKTLNLRHMVVTNSQGFVKGILTRHDLVQRDKEKGFNRITTDSTRRSIVSRRSTMMGDLEAFYAAQHRRSTGGGEGLADFLKPALSPRGEENEPTKELGSSSSSGDSDSDD